MPRRPAAPRPASAAVVTRRILAVLRFLPVGLDDLKASSALHADDTPTFHAALADALAAGAVRREPDTGWYYAVPTACPPPGVWRGKSLAPSALHPPGGTF